MNPEEIAEDFAWLDAWGDRYGDLIDLGRDLPPMDAVDKTEENRIEGYKSGTWIRTDVEVGSPLNCGLLGIVI